MPRATPAQRRVLVVAILATFIAFLDGTVVTEAGEPVPEAQVVAEPDASSNAGDRESWVVRGDQYSIADSGGRFHNSGCRSCVFRRGSPHPSRRIAEI